MQRTENTPVEGGGRNDSFLAIIRGFDAEKQDLLIVLVLVILACAVRLNSLQFCHVISTDGTGYVGAAVALGKGELGRIGSSGFYPVLIWLAGRFFTDLEMAGRVVSIIFGSILVVPLYLLGRALFSRQVALCASLLVVVWPPLVFYSCEVMTQATYICLQLSGIYLVWRMFRQPSALSGALAGLCIALAYFTRPEGVLLFLSLPLPFLFYRFRQLRENWTMPVAYVVGFLVISGANLLLVHHFTGVWQLSAKTNSALNDALSYYLNLPDLIYLPGYEPKGYLDIIRDHPLFIWTNSLKNIRAMGALFPVWFWGLVGIGFLSGGFTAERNLNRFFLFSTLAPLGVIVVFYYVVGGYTEAYLPVFILWGANGLCFLAGKLTEKLAGCLGEKWRTLAGRLPLAAVLALLYAAVVFAPQVREDVPDSAYHPDMDQGRRSLKHIGLMLKESLPPGKIMTRWARIAFYADREWVTIPAGIGFDKIIKIARDNGVRFLIADGLLHSNRPGLGTEIFDPLDDEEQPYGKLFMSDPTMRIRGLKPFLLYTDPQSVGVVVYEIPPLP